MILPVLDCRRLSVIPSHYTIAQNVELLTFGHNQFFGCKFTVNSY